VYTLPFSPCILIFQFCSQRRLPIMTPHSLTPHPSGSTKAGLLSPPLHATNGTGSGHGTGTSSSDGRDRTRGSANDTTSSRKQHRDGSPSRTSRGHRTLGDYTLSETSGTESTGKVKLATHNVTDEKVFVTPSSPLTCPHRSFPPPFLPACFQDPAMHTHLVTSHKPPRRRH